MGTQRCHGSLLWRHRRFTGSQRFRILDHHGQPHGQDRRIDLMAFRLPRGLFHSPDCNPSLCSNLLRLQVCSPLSVHFCWYIRPKSHVQIAAETEAFPTVDSLESSTATPRHRFGQYGWSSSFLSPWVSSPGRVRSPCKRFSVW